MAVASLGALGVTRVVDLPWVLPTGYDDMRSPLGVDEVVARMGSIEAGDSTEGTSARANVVVRGLVKSVGTFYARGRPAVRLVLVPEGGQQAGRGTPTLSAFWFFAAHGVMAAAKVGRTVLLAGRVVPSRRSGSASMVHPRLWAADAGEPRGVEVRYPRVGRVPGARLGRAIGAALERIAPPLLDPVPPAVVAREAMPPLGPMFTRLHRPSEPPQPDLAARVRERMAWAEAFTLAWDRAEQLSRDDALAAPVLPRSASVVERLRVELGFDYTGSQRRAIGEIANDLAGDRPMRRLLFGDVGSGKTAVALAAAALAVAGGVQVAILAPTGVLAEQYLESAAPLARATGAKIALLAASTPPATRGCLLESLEEGRLDVVVGTHALLTDEVRFARLGLVVVDEQQRLGVGQRLSLVRKGSAGAVRWRPHLLTLSATPIPRSLSLVLRGELAASLLSERPPGRETPATTLVSRTDWDTAVLPEIRAALERCERVFIVCPRIGGPAAPESEPEADDEGQGSDDERAAQAPGAIERADELTRVFGDSAVVCVHGQEPAAQMSAKLRAFREGRASILVGTTVVEVGIDVPAATLMVIDGAEYFGLAGLHQLRGRVGRGARKGRCLLVHAQPLSEPSRKRLAALVRHGDGWTIAREDLALRGPGDLSGTRQAGREHGFVYLDPFAEPAWLTRIGDDVQDTRRADPHLAHDEHAGLRLAMDRIRRVLAVREEAG